MCIIQAIIFMIMIVLINTGILRSQQSLLMIHKGKASQRSKANPTDDPKLDSEPSVNSP